MYRFPGESALWKEKHMKLTSLILWLTVGAIVGWIASWMAEVERRHAGVNPIPVENME
jgi:uncharacterized protein involved in response to NO